ncbi:receptor for retinol uptake STRA6 [Aplysia californica]|uniref:Receptor for retinol uptake STRA6 n=1 Tax=Aplysia californica TaxID=6500 RepID=A0ABM0K7S5_APLCA|nr:receptor for retinol uptake STRA6 [Aplysia californica]
MSNVIKAKVLGILHKVIYKSESGFRYPSRLIAVMIVAGIVVYVITLEFMVQLVTLLDYVMDSLLFQMELVGWDQYPGEDKEVTEYRNSLIVSYYFTNIIKICTIVSIALGCVISFLTILHMMSSFRTNLYAMYRGDYRNIPSPYENSGVTLCIGSIKYAGFQVAYIVWAFIISVLILFILCIILAGLIVLIINGVTDWLVNKLLQVWPSLLITLVLLIVQKLLAKFIFLQDRGQWLRLDNRRFFFIFTYFMFFFNIFMGLVSCLLRILKAIGVGTIFLARLDNSTLPRKFEFFDPGFKAYQGFIHMEAAHTHPVVNVFIRLLMALKNERMKQKSSSTAVDVDKVGVNGVTNHTYDGSLKGASDGEVKVRPVNVAARFNWHVTYTLLYNPAIRVYRKGYMQALMRARKEGLKIPISDKPVTDFDLVKTQEEREKERKEEAERIKMEEKKHHMISTGLSSIALGLGSGLNEESDDGVKSRNTKPDKKHGRITGFFKGKNKKNGGGANGGEHHAMFHMQTRDTTEENPQSPSSSSSSPQVVETSDVDVRC